MRFLMSLIRQHKEVWQNDNVFHSWHSVTDWRDETWNNQTDGQTKTILRFTWTVLNKYPDNVVKDDSIKTDVEDIGSEGVDWIKVA
jgi:hypothetical protein